jgi:hypothetical protein
MKVEPALESTCYDAAFWMAGIYDPGLPFAQMGELAYEVCRKLRTIAIAVLSAKADVNTFYHNLVRSGRIRERYLARCIDENQLLDHYRSSGWYAPLMDTIAARDFDLARRIAVLSPADFNEGHEYKDDYCYAQLVFHLIGEGKHDPAGLLARFEAYAEAEPNARLDVMKSLVAVSQEDFDVAFSALLHEHRQTIDDAIESGEFEDLHANASRRIFVEGLAMLRIAELNRLATEREYQFCPSIARSPMTDPFPGE